MSINKLNVDVLLFDCRIDLYDSQIYLWWGGLLFPLVFVSS